MTKPDPQTTTDALATPVENKASDSAAETAAPKATLSGQDAKEAPKPTDAVHVPAPNADKADTPNRERVTESRPSTPAAIAAPARAASTPSTQVTVRRGGFVPMVLGGAVAAGLGAAAMYYALPALPEAWRPAGMAQPLAPAASAIDAQALQAEAVKAAETAAAAQVADLKAQLDALKDRPASVGAPEALTADLEALKAQLAAQAEQLTALASRPVTAGGEAIAGLETEAQALVEQVRQQAAAAQGQIAQAQDQAKALMAQAEQAVQRAQGQGALANLQAAMQTGAPIAAPIAALTDAGVPVPQEIAAAEVPALDSLQASFPDAARAALAATAAADADQQGVLGRVGAFLKVQTGARTVGGPREGTDPDAILSRAEAALGAGDVAGSLAEIATLPEPGQQAMAEWAGRAQAWVAAQEAVAKIAETLN